MSAGITGFSLQTLKKNPCKHLKCSNHFSRDHDAVLVALSAVDLFYSSQSYGIDFSSLRNPQRKTPIEWKLHQWSPKEQFVSNLLVFSIFDWKCMRPNPIFLYDTRKHVHYAVNVRQKSVGNSDCITKRSLKDLHVIKFWPYIKNAEK